MKVMSSLKKAVSFVKKKTSNLFFGKSDERWDWEKFKSTEGFPVSPNLIDWIIGQDHAIEECKLCVDEWVSKLLFLKKKEWWKAFENPMGHKPSPKEMLPAGPFLLMLGDAGTGKSLLGRAMQHYMTELYQKNDVKLTDIVSWKNKDVPQEPKISIHPSPTGKEVIMKATRVVKKKTFWSRWGLKLFLAFMVGLGGFLLFMAFLGAYDYMTAMQAMGYNVNYAQALTAQAPLLIGGASMAGMGFMVWFFSKMLGNIGSNQEGVGGAKSSHAPKLLVDNSAGCAPFIDATGHGSAQLFGSIAWDPYQTGGLGTPEHQRCTAGDVHRAHLGILFIDEIKNLIGMEAITLLTVLEDGQLPIALRSQFHGGDTAAMAVASEPVPCMFFLVAAGNLDSLPNVHPALLDRIQGYGKVVYMTNEMPATPENKRKYVQFMAQEIKRFNLLPFSRDACIAVIEEAMRRSGRNDQLTCKFRPMIGTVKTSSILAKNEKCKIVLRKHVEEALAVHCKSIGLQVMEKYMEKAKTFSHVNPKEKPKIGQIHGLAVSSINQESNDMVGSVLTIRASSVPKTDKKGNGYFRVTGVQTAHTSYIQHSIAKIAHILNQLYNINIEQNFMTHVDFSQSHNVEGPSAGITMTLALISCLTQRKIYQNVAVTGEINIGCGGINEDAIIITPIGGVHEKIMAAQNMGFTKVCIPIRNFAKNIDSTNYKIKIVGCATLEDYLRECLEPEKKCKKHCTKHKCSC
jgi:Lon-like ATP-dependent protease